MRLTHQEFATLDFYTSKDFTLIAFFKDGEVDVNNFCLIKITLPETKSDDMKEVKKRIKIVDSLTNFTIV